MSMVISGDNGLTFPAGSTQVQAGNYQTMVNRIINGRMEIDQRNAGASVTITGSTSLYSVDRWQGAAGSSTGVYTLQQVSDAPTGFVNSIKATVTTAEASVTYNYTLVQRVEGFNTADLGWGTANASSVTLSFWVKSSLTGSFGGSLCNNAFDRAYPFPYTINAANTWEYKTVTIPGDTTGTWLTNNSTGIQLNISLGASAARSATANAWTTTAARQPTGSVNLISTNGATFYITGVDLRVGSYTVVPQDFRAYGTELALCQRYYWSSGSIAPPFATGHCRSSTAADYQLPLKVTMRSAPTLSSTNSGAYMQVAGSNYTITSITAQDSSTVDVLTFRGNVASGLTAGYASVFSGGTATYINASAEL